MPLLRSCGGDDANGGYFDRLLVNEPLFGSTLRSLTPRATHESPGNIDMNDAGQIAFHYQLADGRQGIAVATPVPEPTAASLMLIAAAAVISGRSGSTGKRFARK